LSNELLKTVKTILNVRSISYESKITVWFSDAKEYIKAYSLAAANNKYLPVFKLDEKSYTNYYFYAAGVLYILRLKREKPGNGWIKAAEGATP